MKRIAKLSVIVFALVIFLGCELEQLYLQFYIDSNAETLETPVGTDPTPVAFTIQSGASVAEIAGNLKANQLIADAELFRRYVQYKGIDDRLQAGTYQLNQTMTIPEIARTLQEAEAPDQQVTIPEGKRVEEIAVIVGETTSIAPDAFLQYAQTGWQLSEDLAAAHPILVHVPVTATLEGFLFPDTYRLPLDAQPEDLVDRMLSNMEDQLTPEIQSGFETHGLTLYEGITLASIVEREAVLDSERPVIAGVYHNRLQDGWLLSACPTVQYALGYRPDEGTWWKRTLLFKDLEIASPYNTYRNPGLPPTPIANPGIRAIEAAAHPGETDYYFFMVDCSKEDGSHLFAVTEAEHMANFNRCGGVITTP
jgi:UPF0755 protein